MPVMLDGGIRELVHLEAVASPNGATVVVQRAGAPALRLHLAVSEALTLADQLTIATERRGAA